MMRRMKRAIATVVASIGLLFAAVGSTASAQTSPQPQAQSTPPAPRPPTKGGVASSGLSAQAGGDAADVALERTYPGWSDYDYVRSDVYVSTTDPSTGFFYINDLQFQSNPGLGGYIGLQTKMQDCNANWTVPGVVFSLWDFNGTMSGGSGQFGDAFCSNVESGHPYKSIHYPYNWVPGHWYSLVTQRFYSVYRWNLSAVIYDLTAGTPATYIGTFGGLDPAWSWFKPNTGASTHRSEEFYPGFYSDCNLIHRSVALWGGTWMHSIGNGWIAANPSIIQWIYNKAGLTCTNSSTSGSGTVTQQIGN